MGATKPYTDEEWWSANVDKGALEKALKAHKIRVTSWVNRRPICLGKTDYAEVTEIAQGLAKPKKKRG